MITLVPIIFVPNLLLEKEKNLVNLLRAWVLMPAVSELLEEVLSPTAVSVALAIQEEITGRLQQTEVFQQQQFERARYDAELARRRYLKVDPDSAYTPPRLEMVSILLLSELFVVFLLIFPLSCVSAGFSNAHIITSLFLEISYITTRFVH